MNENETLFLFKTSIEQDFSIKERELLFSHSYRHVDISWLSKEKFRNKQNIILIMSCKEVPKRLRLFL